MLKEIDQQLAFCDRTIYEQSTVIKIQIATKRSLARQIKYTDLFERRWTDTNKQAHQDWIGSINQRVLIFLVLLWSSYII